MNLLDKANIITTPTAYSEGKLHSVKPEIVLGPELVTNGDFKLTKVTYTIINYVSGNVRSIFNGSTTDGNGTTRNANGTFTELVQSTDNASGTFSFGAVAGSFIRFNRQRISKRGHLCRFRFHKKFISHKSRRRWGIFKMCKS
jgi:hypothetical protein